ncbi:hypothetical protein HY643_03225 [Candidatus Woesearchaeota archaeon]|nr:hypothetical protein [Candidatus Woesearchaeota archaeon]
MINELVVAIKNKKELKSLSSAFVEGIAKEFLQKKQIKQLPQPKSRDYKIIIKEIRKTLREVYGVFKEKNFEKRKKILQEITSLNDLDAHKKILSLHKSTKERIDAYPIIYQKIFSETGKPKKILDLGCGLNPVSYPFMQLTEVEYVATELTEEDAAFIEEYFKKMKINGKTIALDLTKTDQLPESDICFLFKLLDTLETLKRGVTKELIEKIKTNFLVISFPTQSLGGRKGLTTKRLKWFEQIINKYKHTTFETQNEKFYIIKKQ